MKFTRWLYPAIVLILLNACSSGSDGVGLPGLFASPTPLPTAVATIIHAPDAKAAISTYLDALKVEDYATMYAMLTAASRDSLDQETFAGRYRNALNTMSAASLDYELISSLTNPNTAQVAFRVTYHTSLLGDLQRDIVVHLSLEEGQWKIQWDDGLILPELSGGNTLAMDYETPARGDIYDRNGEALAAQSDAVALGIIPGEINPKSEGTLIFELSKVTGIHPDVIRARVAAAAPDWYVPVGQASAAEAQRLLNMKLGGLVVMPYNARYYFNNGIAPQVVGYTQFISAEELDQYRRLGYAGNEKVGKAGIEKWGEPYLAGKHGGTLYVIGPQGQIITTVSSSRAQPASSIYLTIDNNLQIQAQQAIAGFRGAVVVLERDTGRVLAMASSPDFDPNLFEPNNYNYSYLLEDLLNDPDQPLVNRAAQEVYPLGSVFKIITMAAGMESGLYLRETTYDCQYQFTEIPGVVLYDWTWDHCQDRTQRGLECNTSDSMPSGLLTLEEGLMRSCNPYFWHIAYDLYTHDRASDIANMARAFGLGQATGIEQIAEATGNIGVPGTPLEATNQAIGQGDVRVTPLQMAVIVAAVGNGGTLYRPQLVEKIQPIEGEAIAVFKPEARGTLPLRADNLKVIQDAMVRVIFDPRGTANFRLRGFNIPSAGKTGTAESAPDEESHAWFAGYTMASENTGLPDIAVVVILENAGEGSDYAAPVFRRIVESYIYGSPQALYWWESSFGVTRTPTPLGGIPTRTPRP